MRTSTKIRRSNAPHADRTKGNNLRLHAGFVIAVVTIVSLLTGGLVDMPALQASAAGVSSPGVDEPSVGDVVERDETSNTTFAGGGVFITEIMPEPINVVNSAGDWKPAESNLTLQADGTLVAGGHPMQPELTADASERNSLSVADGDYSLGFTLQGAQNSTVVALVTRTDPSVAFYPEVFPEIDLKYELTASAIKETLVLNEQPETGEAEWVWTARAPGLDLVKSDTGQLNFLDTQGDVRFHIPAPVMWDSSSEDEIRESAERMLETTITELGTGQWAIRVSADAAWLADAARVYPIHVDPTVSLGDSSVVSYKSDGATRTDYVHVGNSRDSNTNKTWRALVKYDYATVFGKQVLSAKIDATYVSGTTTSQTGSVNIASCRGYSCVGSTLGNLVVGVAGTVSNTSLTGTIADWVDARVPGKAILIRGSEASEYTYKALNTSLKITWKEFPKVQGMVAPSPASGGDTTKAPSLNVTVVIPTGYTGLVRYFVSKNNDPEISPIYVSEWAEPGAIELPSDLLEADLRYFRKAQVQDSRNGLYGTSTVRDSLVWSFYARNASPTFAGISAVLPSVDAEVLSVGTRPTWVGVADDSDGDLTRLTVEIYGVGPDGTAAAVVAVCVSGWQLPGRTAQCQTSQGLPTDVPLTARARVSDGWLDSAWSDWLPFSSSPTILEQAAEETQQVVEFEHPVSLTDAIVETQTRTDILGFRYESSDVVGEWYPGSDRSSDDFLASFLEEFGTQPEVTSVITSGSQTAPTGTVIHTSAPTYQAPQADGPAIQAFESVDVTPPEQAPTVIPLNTFEGTKLTTQSSTPELKYWDPNYVRTKIQKTRMTSGSSTVNAVKFTNYYLWDGVNTSPTKLDPDFGLEFENNVVGNNYAAGFVRCDGVSPLLQGVAAVTYCQKTCSDSLSAGLPVAQKSGWSWRVYMKSNTGNLEDSKAAIKSLGAYADYNDLLDDCDRNAISVGLLRPEKIAKQTNGQYALYIDVTAPKGVAASSTINGIVQAVERHNCLSYIAVGRPQRLTNCMGQNPYFTWDGPGRPYRITLNVSKKWNTPNKCWESSSYGIEMPKPFVCADIIAWK